MLNNTHYRADSAVASILLALTHVAFLSTDLTCVFMIGFVLLLVLSMKVPCIFISPETVIVE
jgi:hypothetical protein